jgi:enoyl-CoA hydratase
MAGETEGLAVSIERSLLRLTLTPAAGRAPVLTSAIRRAATDALKRAARDPMIYAAMIESGDAEIFSSGRGEAEVARLRALPAPERVAALAADAFAAWHLDRYVKPTVALVSGGIAYDALPIVLHATHRLGGEGFSLRLPGLGADLLPDCGVARWLARLPDRLGVYLALSGERLGRAAALELGLLTHAIASAEATAIRAALADAEPVDPVLDSRAIDPGPAPDWPRAAMADCFDAGSIEDILARLAKVRGAARPWAEATSLRLRPRAGDAKADALIGLLRSTAGIGLEAALVKEHAALSRQLAGDQSLLEPLAEGSPELISLYEPPGVLG